MMIDHSVQYSMHKDKTCQDGEFFMTHPKHKQATKCKHGIHPLLKSWSGKIQKKHAGSKWVTITDPSSPMRGRHILIVPHKDGTASIAWAPEHSGLTHKILQPKKKKADKQKPKPEKKEKKKKELTEEQAEKYTAQKKELTQKKKERRTKLHEMIREKAGVETEVSAKEKQDIEKKIAGLDKKKKQIERLKEFNKINNKKKDELEKVIDEAKKVMLGGDPSEPDPNEADEKKSIREAIKENSEDFLKAWYAIKETDRELKSVNKILKTGNETKSGSDIVAMDDITSDDIIKRVEDEKAVMDEIEAHYNLIINTRGGIDKDGNEIKGKGVGSKVMGRHINTGATEAITGLTGEMAGTSILEADIAKELGASNVAVLADYYMENTVGGDYERRINAVKKYIEEKGNSIAKEAVDKGDKYLEMAQRVRKHAKGEDALYASVQQGTAASLAYTNRAYEAYGQAEGALNQVAELLHQFDVKKDHMVIKATNRPALNRKIAKLGLNKSDVSILRHGHGDYELRIPKRSYEKLIHERVVSQFQSIGKEPSPEKIITGQYNTDNFTPSNIKTHLDPDKNGNTRRIVPTQAQQSAARLVAEQKKVYLNWEAGTGKSLAYLESIAHASDKAGKPLKTVISMPKKLMGNFKEEVEKFSNYKVEIVSSNNEAIRKQQYASDPNTIVVVNKEKFHFDKDHIKEAGFNMVIADEAHKITQRADGAGKGSMMSHGLSEVAKNAEYFIAGTGTPTPNNLSELYFHLNIIDPDKYSSQKAFMDKYKNLHKGSGLKDKLADIMNAELSDRVMTQKKEQNGKFFENVHKVDLTATQREGYKETQKKFKDGKIMGITRDQRLTSVLNDTHHSDNNKYAKMKEIVDNHLKTKGDSEKVLFYAKNYKTVRMIEDFLKTHYPEHSSVRFTGTDAKGRDMNVKRIADSKNKFLTDGKAKFAIHTDAGTEGLNLQHTGEKDRPYGATTVVAMASGLDSYANLDQFFSRANRKGATKDVHGHLILTDTPHDMNTEERLGDKRAVMGLIDNAKVRDEHGVVGDIQKPKAQKSIWTRRFVWA